MKKATWSTSSTTRSQTYPSASGSLVGFSNGNMMTAMPTTAAPEMVASKAPTVTAFACSDALVRKSGPFSPPVRSCSATKNAMVWVRNSRPTMVAVLLVGVAFGTAVMAVMGPRQRVDRPACRVEPSAGGGRIVDRVQPIRTVERGSISVQ